MILLINTIIFTIIVSRKSLFEKDVTNNDYEGYVYEFDEKKLLLKVGDKVRISKYKDIFAKGYTPNWTKEVFIVRNIKGTMPRTY